MKDKIKFKEFMAMLCELHDKSMSSVLADLYWKVLEPFPDDICEQALREVTAASRFFPKPVDLIEAINGKREHESTRAWLQAYNTLCRIGNYPSVKFKDEAIHSVVQAMGGWPQFCSMVNDEVKWKQREFEKLYQVISSREGKHPAYLPGTTELDNGSKGLDIKPEIILIGFENLKMIA